MNWKEKRDALLKLQNGEWEKDGDEALEKAKNYVGKDGEIIGGEENIELPTSTASSGIVEHFEETIAVPGSQKK